MEILEITPDMMILVPIVVGLVQVVRRIVATTPWKKYEDVAAVVSSLVLGVVLVNANPIADTNTLLQGLSVGLMASGLFSGSKTVINKFSDTPTKKKSK